MHELSNSVLAEIEKRKLKPRPIFYFLGKRAVFWILAALSTLIGGISSAVALFALQNFIANGGSEGPEMVLDDIAWTLPVMWMVLLGLALASAVIGLRHTRRGYRVGVGRFLGIVLAASIGIGAILHFAEAGEAMHYFLMRNVPVYARYATVPYAYWSRPQLGFLGGEVLKVNGGSMTLRDFRGKEWTVDISSAKNTVSVPLADAGDIVMTGEPNSLNDFTAATIAPFE